MKKIILTIFSLIRGFAVLYAALCLARFINPYIGNFLPSSILGMLIILLLLQSKIIPPNWVINSSKLIIRWMALFFVPISVALINHFDLLISALPALIVTCAIGTTILIPIVGRAYQAWENRS